MFFFLLTISFHGAAQNLDQIGQVKPFNVTGGFGVNQVFHASGATGYREPYNYYLTGNLNIDLYGLALPFSFSYSNQQSSFRQPFNQFSLTPSYKWAKAYMGYTSMSFSPYTLNGHIFEGAGIEATPSERWQVALLYGRFRRYTVPDSANAFIGTYRRIGYGVNVRYGSNTDHLGVSAFYSKDDKSRLSELYHLGLFPEENLVLGTNLAKTLGKYVQVQAEYALSMLTRDSQAARNDSVNTLGIFRWRNSTEAYSAYNVSLNYQQDNYSLGLRYERVGAGYETHGAYYFNNDFDNLTARTKFKILRNKGTVNVNAGLQRSNTDESRMNTTSRVVASLAFAYQPIQSFSLNAGYSNFTTYTNIDRRFLDQNFLTPFDRLDTLNYMQVSQQANLSVNYSLPGSDGGRSLLANLSFMESSEEQQASPQATNSTFISSQIGYRQQSKQLGLEFNTLLNLQINRNLFSFMEVLGPLVSISKFWFERKLRSSFSAAFNRVINRLESPEGNLTTNNHTLNLRLIAAYQVKGHALQLSLINVNRWGIGTVQSEFTANLGYNYRF